MDPQILDDLACVRKVDNRICGGRLRFKRTMARFEDSRDEIKEGVLTCSQCQEQYPVLLGIPILMPEIPKFLRANYYWLMGVCRFNGGLGPEMQAYLVAQILRDLEKADEELFPGQERYGRAQASDFFRRISSYLINHYDNLMDLVEKDDPIYVFLSQYGHKNPHTVLERMVSSQGNGRNGVAVEVGCSVGGFAARLSRSFKFVYGVDVSFEALVLARRILKHLPKPLVRYRVYREREQYCWRRLKAPRCEKVEFLCASGSALPLRDRSVDAVCTANVIDIVPEPLCLLQEKIRVLREDGLFLMSDPYDFHPSRLKEFPASRRRTPREMIREVVAEKVAIVDEEDNIPWVRRSYRRNYDVYFNHCLVGIRKGHGRSPHTAS